MFCSIKWEKKNIFIFLYMMIIFLINTYAAIGSEPAREVADEEARAIEVVKGWQFKGRVARSAEGSYYSEEEIFDGVSEEKGITIGLFNQCHEPMVLGGLFMNYGRCTAKPENPGGVLKNKISIGDLDTWELSNKRSYGPAGQLEYIGESGKWGIRFIMSRKRGGSLEKFGYELSPDAGRYISVESSPITGSDSLPRHNRIFHIRSSLRLTAPLTSTRVPARPTTGAIKMYISGLEFDGTGLNSLVASPDRTGCWITQISKRVHRAQIVPGMPVPSISHSMSLARTATVGTVTSKNWSRDDTQSTTHEVSESLTVGWAAGAAGGWTGIGTIGSRHAFVNAVMKHVGGGLAIAEDLRDDRSMNITINDPCPSAGLWSIKCFQSRSADVVVPYSITGAFWAIKQRPDSPPTTEEEIRKMLEERNLHNVLVSSAEPVRLAGGEVGLNFRMTGNILVDLIYTIEYMLDYESEE